jgi:hypothetical protein
MEQSKQPFGQQAARFSLYVPLTVIIIRLFTYGNMNQAGVAITVTSINVLLVIAGFFLGIFALFSMRRYGSKGILVRAILGILINGVLFVAVLLILVPPILAGQVRQKVVGHWQLRTQPDSSFTQCDISFNQDGTYHLQGVTGGTSISVGGKWSFDENRVIAVNLDHVDKGDPNAVGKQILLGKVSEADAHHLSLTTDKGVESYDRIP